MGDHRLIDDLNRYSACVIGVVLNVLAGYSLVETGIEDYHWTEPGWEVYFVFFGLLFFIYFYKRAKLARNFGFMLHNFFRGMICAALALSISGKGKKGKNFELMRNIGFYALIVNLVICLLALLMSGGDRRYSEF
jgi:hypothetical protein